jgi:hypothetical protein
MIIYYNIYIYIYIYDYLWLFMIVYDYLWLFMINYDDLWLFMIIYDYLWLFMIMYDYVWLFMIIYVYFMQVWGYLEIYFRSQGPRYGPIWTWFAGIITPFLRLDNKLRCKNQESEKLGKTQMFQKLWKIRNLWMFRMFPNLVTWIQLSEAIRQSFVKKPLDEVGWTNKVKCHEKSRPPHDSCRFL